MLKDVYADHVRTLQERVETVLELLDGRAMLPLHGAKLGHLGEAVLPQRAEQRHSLTELVVLLDQRGFQRPDPLHECPVERGSQTVNSGLMAEATRVISL